MRRNKRSEQKQARTISGPFINLVACVNISDAFLLVTPFYFSKTHLLSTIKRWICLFELYDLFHCIYTSEIILPKISDEEMDLVRYKQAELQNILNDTTFTKSTAGSARYVRNTLSCIFITVNVICLK